MSEDGPASNKSEDIEKLREDRLKEIVKEEVKKETRQKDEKIKELQKEIEGLKANSNVPSKDNSHVSRGGISRREFLKKAGLGTAGLAALGLSPASALNLRSDSLSFADSDDEYFNIDASSGEVSISKADLNLNERGIRNVGDLELPLEGPESDLEDEENRFWVDEGEEQLKVKIGGTLYTAEIQNTAIPESGLLHYHPGDDGSGTTLTDNEGSANFDLDGPSWVSRSDFKGGYGLEFTDGDNATASSYNQPTERTRFIRLEVDEFTDQEYNGRNIYTHDSTPLFWYHTSNEQWEFRDNSDVDLGVSEPIEDVEGSVRIAVIRVDDSEARVDIYDKDKNLVNDNSRSDPDTSYDGSETRLGDGRLGNTAVDPFFLTYDHFKSDSEVEDVLELF